MLPGKPIRILLIDDDEDDHLMFRDLLAQVRDAQFQVEWRSSYALGLEALAQGGVDVCFMDYRLGGHTGIDLLREALTMGCKIPIILLTGYGEHEVDLEAMRLGAADYLVKDQVSPLLLERSIRYSIHRARSIQAILDREAQILVQDRLASVGLLASSLAHEIGTPLGVIRGRAEVLESKLREQPELRKNAEVIIAQIDRVSKLIRSLLTLARGDGAKQASAVDVGTILEEVLELMGHEFRRHGIELAVSLPEAERPAVLAEAGPLHQVFLNLFVNSVHAIESARKAGRPSGHSLRIGVQERTASSGRQWVITVADTGCGISAANMKNLFKPFFTTKDIGSGTGLGLATSYRLVEGWGGSIEVSSVEGKGTEFQLFLPRA